MTPRQYLRAYRYDERTVTGSFYSSEPLSLEQGDTVGIVLCHVGGPDTAEDVTPFLYNLYMDPALLGVPLGGLFRHWLCRIIAPLYAKSVRQEYEAIGGGSPIYRLAREQAGSLRSYLNNTVGEAAGITFCTYVSMRYWHPFAEETARKMEQDGVNKVVFLPMFPQYSKTTTGSALSYWWQLEQAREIPSRPTTFVFEYAAHPKYIQAVSERIDEALQRFSRRQRQDVPLLFSAHGTPIKEMKERGDPYCCLIHATVDRVMAYRKDDRTFVVSYHGKVGPSEWLVPRTAEALRTLARNGHSSVLVVPVGLVTEHLETTYVLDIAVRDQARKVGLTHFEVVPALNCHPLFIEALGEATLAQLHGLRYATPSNGVLNGTATAVPTHTFRPQAHFDSSERCTRCPKCRYVAEAQRWQAGTSVEQPQPMPRTPGDATDA